MYDVRKKGSLSAKQDEKLQKMTTTVQQCLDMHYVFIPGIEQWIKVNLQELGLGVRTPPAQGILDAIEGLYIWERPLEMLYARVGKQHELEELAKEKGERHGQPCSRARAYGTIPATNAPQRLTAISSRSVGRVLAQKLQYIHYETGECGLQHPCTYHGD